MITFNKTTISAVEIVKGEIIKPVVLNLLPETGQIIGRPLKKHSSITHVGIILGQHSQSGDVYICSFNVHGIEILNLESFLEGQKITYISHDASIEKFEVLVRLKTFLDTNPNIKYCLGKKNCLWFTYKIVYGQDLFTFFKNTLILLLFTIVFLVFQ